MFQGFKVSRLRKQDAMLHGTLTQVDLSPDTASVMSNQEQVLDRQLRAIADPSRRKILHALKERGVCSIGKEMGLCACDIQERVRLTQPTISHHMAILTQAGLVEARKEGQWMWYRRNETALKDLARDLREML